MRPSATSACDRKVLRYMCVVFILYESKCRKHRCFPLQISVVSWFLFLRLAECAGGHGAGHIYYRLYIHIFLISIFLFCIMYWLDPPHDLALHRRKTRKPILFFAGFLVLFLARIFHNLGRSRCSTFHHPHQHRTSTSLHNSIQTHIHGLSH
jgi:hypothetical protein